MPVASENVGVAFAMTIGAGLATALGACVVFFPRLVKLASRRALASGLGLSAGVMIYVSFGEITVKSYDSFVLAGLDEARSYFYMTLCFFGGVVVISVLDLTVKLLTGEYHCHGHDVYSKTTPPCCAEDPVAELEHFHKRAAEEEQAMARQEAIVDSNNVCGENPNSDASKTGGDDIETNTASFTDNSNSTRTHEDKELMKMGITTALAIAIHNFPEGLATFVATLADPAVGAVLGIAVGIHNIPEGVCVALPVYYATGNRWKGFFMALISGVAEPVAAFFGWLILASHFSDVAYGVLFGLVSGMMVTIVMKELMPTAHKYDPLDTIVTHSFVTGMAVMALSLVLFKASGQQS